MPTQPGRPYAVTWQSSADSGLSPMPALPETVAAFVDFQAVTAARPRSAAMSARSPWFHRAAEVQNPCTAQVVRLALKRMHRARGRAQKQAGPLKDALVEQLLRTPSIRLINLRHRARLTVAYVTMCAARSWSRCNLLI